MTENNSCTDEIRRWNTTEDTTVVKLKNLKKREHCLAIKGKTVEPMVFPIVPCGSEP